MQKLNCYICDHCRVVINYGQAPTDGPHYCSEQCKAEEELNKDQEEKEE